jgi:hypothetical protein
MKLVDLIGKKPSVRHPRPPEVQVDALLALEMR